MPRVVGEDDPPERQDRSCREAGSQVSTAIEELRLLHALPGRMRVHLARWPREGQCVVETRLYQVPGIYSVQVNPLTGNILIHFDPTATDEQTILAAVRTLQPDSSSLCGEILTISPEVLHRRRPSTSAPGARLRLAGQPHVAGPTSILQNEGPRLSILDILDLILKAACVVLNLFLADGPLALVLGGMEVVRLFMEVVGRQGARRRDGVWQEPDLLALLVPGAVDVSEPMSPATGRTGRYA